MTHDRFRTVLADAFPGRAVVDVTAVQRGNSRATAVARFASEPPVVVQLGSSAAAVRTETALTRAVRERTAIPVPATVATGHHDGVAYLARDYQPGDDLHTAFVDLTPTQHREIAATFGTSLGELHRAFTFEGCGDLTVDDTTAPTGSETPTLVAESSDCTRWFRDYGLSAVDRLPPAFDALESRLLACIRETTVDRTEHSRLFPWDLRPGNALVDGADVVAVLDWERPRAAPPALSVAKTEYLVADWYVDDAAPLRAAFKRGYERIRPLPEVQPGHRVVAIADSAVDSEGVVTNPRYPELDRPGAIDFHRSALERVLAAADDC